MKRIGMISILALVIATPAFATGIGASAESADCDNDVLGTYTGPAALSANWTANTINLDFYDGENKLSSGTCTYDGGIELPNDPTKEGYEFSGWKVRRAAAAPQCDTSALSTASGGSAYGFSKLNGGVGSNEARYGLTVGSGEWASEFSWGIVKGVARCSTKDGNYSNKWSGTIDDWGATETELINGNPAMSDARYCWCKIIGFDENKDGEYCSVYTQFYVVFPDRGSNENCLKQCADDCAHALILDNKTGTGFRSAMFETINQ